MLGESVSDETLQIRWSEELKITRLCKREGGRGRKQPRGSSSGSEYSKELEE